jgi:hypothetical protein
MNWDTFAELPGAATTNFEMLCRAIIRRHYVRFGDFVALANQPGVEFHLKLRSECSLGEAERWYGWQCRWYELPSGRAIGTTRRKKIVEALATTEADLPNITDWVLWTRYPLTKGDQEWFHSLPTHMRLHMWTAAEVEEHLSGPAEILRGIYFGELILTPDLLGELHEKAVARIKRRWQPEVHQVMDAERTVRSSLGAVDAWTYLNDLADRLAQGATAVAADSVGLPASLSAGVICFVEVAQSLAASVADTHAALERGDYEILRQQLANLTTPRPEWNTLVRQLRSGRYPATLVATNVLADMHGVHKALSALHDALSGRLVAVVADAGCGKTELSAQLTAPTDDRPAGILLHGADLHARHSLDDLANRMIVHGKAVPTFEALVAAVDAAGQRAGRRLPIVIDGLNEAEDPRVWKGLLATLAVTMRNYSFALVVCTLRSQFANETLPDEMEYLEMPGFEHDTDEAVQRYFQYYRINPADAELPWGLLQHPLTLRMFCEVTNPDRIQTVGVEAMPGSLTALFERYLEQVAVRITELAPHSLRFYASDVRTALNEIGSALWEENARSLDLTWIRRRLGDESRAWNESIVRALEHDGVLLRTPGDQPSAGHIIVLYDALAGHLVADAILDQFGGRDFAGWLHAPGTTKSLSGGGAERHPLATDIFHAFVGLVPRRMHRRQLWPLLDDPLRTKALYQAARLEGAYLDRETVSQLSVLVGQAPTDGRELFDRLRTTRAARSHPLDARFLDSALRSMTVSERDLRWSEWIRRNNDKVIEDIQWLELRWRSQKGQDQREHLRALWTMWTLTSTVRLLRDHATRALYWFGCYDPDAFFEMTIDSLAINDPYVRERMLAACYGVAMDLWADPRGAKVRDALPAFANELVDRFFAPGALYPTRHVLTRDYAIGVITISSIVTPGCVTAERLRFVEPPFSHFSSPFPPASEISEAEVAEAKGAISMDFGNYTIGRLIKNRSNYDFKNPTYQEVRRQIDHRIVELGYSKTRFGEIDRIIGGESWRGESNGTPKTDRYGKKYSWIAYFEMYGLRLDEGALPEWRAGERSSDSDIDPSFPEPVRSWQPPLPDLFTDAPVATRAWVADGPTPNYDNLLHCNEVDGQPGPWVLLNGYIQQSDVDDMRRVFTFLRGILISRNRLGKALASFDTIDYPGNDTIPAPSEDHYTFAGEIPWSSHFARGLRDTDGRSKQDVRGAFIVYDGKRWLPGIPVEIPVYDFSWESYHSALNQVSGITVPAPALCDKLGLSNRQGEWDLYDSAGGLATLYREYKSDKSSIRSNLLYLREDLMNEYLKQTRQTLVWFLWGERDIEYRMVEKLQEELQDTWSSHKQIHRHRLIWEPGQTGLLTSNKP